ncbi:MAG TPA: YraN family protein [Bacteroidales bacterium]|nr:YraN family protein [Bacteroidales bacterium]HOU95199.1 YraN family protein [Bacteroidales bacterium]HQG35966.1 YraN family protein [Bacteroidales bacterium]HQG52970.1 YraN family protein [Bacteroidales bacterium]HQJ20805.1 YraN family protein [Bacteroidales bacterium]
MTDINHIGPAGEGIAEKHLIDKGYKILNRNWKSGQKEIDIIAENEKYIVFVEVKTRKDDYYLHPRDAVTTQKQKMIIYAAESYLKIYNLDKECRFDIITVISDGNSFTVEHIEDAFYPTLR